MDAYSAVIRLHNLGYQLKALDNDQIAIKPTAKEEHAEMIMAIRKEPQVASRTIRLLPLLHLITMPAELKQYAADLFRNLKEQGYVQIVAIMISKTGETEWAFIPTHNKARSTMREIVNFEWKGVNYLECQEEGKCRGA